MLDYYSSCSQPSKEQRIKDVLNNLSGIHTKGVSTKQLMQVIENVVSEAPVFSASGYAVFGKNDAINKTVDELIIIQSNNASNCTPCFR